MVNSKNISNLIEKIKLIYICLIIKHFLSYQICIWPKLLS